MARRGTLVPLVLVALSLAGLGATRSETAPADGGAERPTFYRDVLPVLQNDCQECHRPRGTSYGGQLAPMALTGYDEVRPWARAIARKVKAREMPPWDADPRHDGVFLNERVLAASEIDTLVRWADTGASAGDPADAPPPRVFANQDGWMIGEPDLIVEMPEPYWVADDVADLYAAFSVDLTEEQLPRDRWIVAFQCKPDSDLVHHFNANILAPVDGKLPPPPKFPGPGEIAPDPANAGRYIGGVASGTDSLPYPDGFALRLEKGSRVSFDIHYHKEPGAGTGKWDRSKIGFKLTDKPPTRQLGTGMDGRGPISTYRFEIPPGVERYQLGPVSRTFTQDSDIIQLMPHMHMRGASATFEVIYPSGEREVLLHVPEYDFSWQTVYRYRGFKRVPAGTSIEFTAWYDNTAEKGARFGFDPTQTVRFGRESTDEMMMGFVTAAAVEPQQ